MWFSLWNGDVCGARVRVKRLPTLANQPIRAPDVTHPYPWTGGDNESQTANGGTQAQAATIEIQTWCTYRRPGIEDAIREATVMVRPTRTADRSGDDVVITAWRPGHGSMRGARVDDQAPG